MRSQRRYRRTFRTVRTLPTLAGLVVVAGLGVASLHGLAHWHLSSPTAGTSTSSTPGPSTAPGPIIARGHGWSATGGLDGPIPAPGSCHYRHAADGEDLPDPRCTPGAVDAAVTNTNIHATICRAGGYTASVRPPEPMTEKAKRQLMAAYSVPWSQASHYELDHLIELNAGGASDVRNLWPEPDTDVLYPPSAFVHNDKDAVEAWTRTAICAGTVLATSVQHDISLNWTTAVAALHLAPIPRDYRG